MSSLTTWQIAAMLAIPAIIGLILLIGPLLGKSSENEKELLRQRVAGSQGDKPAPEQKQQERETDKPKIGWFGRYWKWMVVSIASIGLLAITIFILSSNLHVADLPRVLTSEPVLIAVIVIFFALYAIFGFLGKDQKKPARQALTAAGFLLMVLLAFPLVNGAYKWILLESASVTSASKVHVGELPLDKTPKGNQLTITEEPRVFVPKDGASDKLPFTRGWHLSTPDDDVRVVTYYGNGYVCVTNEPGPCPDRDDVVYYRIRDNTHRVHRTPYVYFENKEPT